jgi:hypothetical protein
MVHSKQLSQHLAGGTEHKQFPILTTFSLQYTAAVLSEEACVVAADEQEYGNQGRDAIQNGINGHFA